MDRKIILALVALVACLYFLSQLSSPHDKVSKSVSPIINASQSSDQHTILGQPTINAVFINQTLCAAKSPACGTGMSLYSYGKQYNIDPAYALAFFWHESQFGKYGVAAENKGLGNIRCTPGYRCLNGFRAYSSWAAGYQDWYALIRNFYINDLHKTTIEAIVPTYAPSVENDTQGYIASVVSSVQTWRREA
jgi:hypothetical protein